MVGGQETVFLWFQFPSYSWGIQLSDGVLIKYLGAAPKIVGFLS